MRFKLLLLAILCVTCTPSSDNVRNKTRLATTIDEFLSESVSRLKIAGLTVAATRNDSIVYEGAFGYRNYATKEPMNINYVFHWASVSKTFVATAAMQLVEQHKLKLDEKLVTYLPYFTQKEGNYKEITIQDILNHTSGIGDVEDYEWDKPQNDEGAPERYVRSLSKDKMRFDVGKDWAYSNTAFEIMGVVIAKASGLSFEEYMKKNIFDPLEMTHSSFAYPDIPDSLRVKGHHWSSGPEVINVYPYNRIHAPSSTLNTSVLDITHYAIANLNRGIYKGKRILPDSAYNLLWTNSVKLEGKPKVGLSWFLQEFKGLKTASHSGSDTGFRSFLLLVPEKNISIEIACNYEQGEPEQIGNAVLDIMLGNKPEPLKRAIGFAFGEIVKTEGLEKAKAFYLSTEKDSVARRNFIWDENEGAMAYPGYSLLDQGKTAEAIEIFKFNVELHPDSGHGHGNLGLAYEKAGDKKQAIANLKRAVELLPKARYFRERLKELEK